MIKKILKITLIFFIILVLLAFAVPFLFKDKIVLKIKSAINKNLYAKVDFTDVDVSLFRHFPRVSLTLDKPYVMGIHEFEKDTLISAGKIDMALDLISVIKGDHIKVYTVTLDSPRIHAIVDKDGKVNWDITKKDTTSIDSTKKEKDFDLELKQYNINNGFVSYIDKKSNISSEIINLNHEGSGDFTSDIFILKTTTSAEALNFSMNNVPYLVDAKTSIKADIQVNNKTNTYQYETGNISINGLQLASKGFLQLLNDSTYNMDIAFNAPATDFKHILSLIPAIYKHDFEKIKTSGKAVFNGFLKGTYSGQQLPAYALNLDIKNGFFQYPDLPRPVKNINLELKVENRDGITDHAVINIPRAHIEMDDEPFDFRLMVKNPVSDMFIDAAAKGKLDLSKITQFIKLESGTKLSGLVKADVSAKGTISAMEHQQYEQFEAAGTIAVSSLQYASNDYPDGVKVNNLFMAFNPRNIAISDLDGQYKKTNFSANGSINGLLPYIFKDKTLSGAINLKADKMNLNDWMGTSADTTSKNVSGSQPFAVPANIDFSINAAVGRLLYDKLEIEQLEGNMIMRDQTVVLNNVNGHALDGSMMINGTYSTKISKSNPDISLNYDVKGLDVQKTFYAFNTVQKLMPVGEYMSGRLSSQLKMNGKMSNNMMPDLSSLSGQGNLLLIEGFLKKFAPLEKLADLLNIKELREISMKDIKNYIEFNDGMVLVKPFTVKVKDIEMEIGGMHGFNQSLDYIINLKVPRALMGDKGNAYINNLVTQVNNKGIPLKLGETVNLHVKLGGTLKNPVLKTDLKETAGNTAEQLKQQAVAFAQSKIDSTKKAFKDTAISVRKQLEKDLQDELKKRIFNKDTTTSKGSGLDSSKRRMEDAGRGLLKDLLKIKKTRDTTEH